MGRCLMYAQPQSLHILNPAHDRTESRVHSHHLHTLPLTPGNEILPKPPVPQRRKHPRVPGRPPLQLRTLPRKVQPLKRHRLPNNPGVTNHLRHRVPNHRLRLLRRPPIRNHRNRKGIQPVAREIRLRNRKMVRIEVHSHHTQPPVGHHRDRYPVKRGKHPPTLRVPLETVADRLTQMGRHILLRHLRIHGTVLPVIPAGIQGRHHMVMTMVEVQALKYQVLPMLPNQTVRKPQPQVQFPVLTDPRKTGLIPAALIPAPQHKEGITPGSTPVLKPLLMRGVPVGLQRVLRMKQLPRPEANPHPLLNYIPFHLRKPELQIGQTALLAMHRTEIPPTHRSGQNLPGPGNAPDQVILLPQQRGLPGSNPSGKLHPQGIEHPGGNLPLRAEALLERG